MSCCGARVIITPANDEISDVVYFISSTTYCEGISLYNSNTVTNITSTIATVPVPFGKDYNSNFYYSVFPSDDNDNTRLLYQDLYHEDSNTTKILTYPYEYAYAPIVQITPYTGTHSSNILIPQVFDVTSSNLTYGVFDLASSSYTSDYAFVSLKGAYNNSNLFTHSDNDPTQYTNYLNQVVGTFTTPPFMDTTNYFNVTLSAYFYYVAAVAGSEFGYYMSSNATPLGNPAAQSIMSFNIYPPINFGTTPFSGSYTSSIMLQANTTYYMFQLQAYPTVMSNFAGTVSFSYNPDL